MLIGSNGGPQPRQVLVLLMALAAGVALWSGCPGPGPYVKVPAPTTFTGRIDSAPRAAVLTYARSRDYDTTHGVGDYRRVMVGSCPACSYGPHVFLSPERNAGGFDTTTLAQGRVLARMINRDAADSYPKFNLAPGDTVYWWVDRRGPGNTWRSVYVSSNPRRALMADSFYYMGHVSAFSWGRTIARFLWKDTDEALWVACDMTGCCRSSGADIY